MPIKYFILTIIGLSAGAVVAAGVFAFITMLTIVPRMAARTKTAVHIKKYENSIILGGILGNIIIVFSLNIPVGVIGLCLYGLFSGVFVGCLAVALVEVLRVIPIFSMRIKLRNGFSYIVLSIAVGKFLGALFQFFYK